MSNLDLNLLRVFDAILRERNVLRASQYDSREARLAAVRM
jgi:hypothetical protein